MSQIAEVVEARLNHAGSHTVKADRGSLGFGCILACREPSKVLENKVARAPDWNRDPRPR